MVNMGNPSVINTKFTNQLYLCLKIKKILESLIMEWEM